MEEIKTNEHNKDNKIKAKKFLIILLILFICLWNIFFGMDKAKKDATVTINSGESIIDIAEALEDEKVISKKIKFISRVIISGNKSNLKFGTFEFKKGMKYGEIIDTLVNEGAKRTTFTLTIPEGYSVENVISKLEKEGVGTRDEIREALKLDYDFEFLKEIPKRNEQYYYLEGFLFPSTYEFYSDATPEHIIKTMLSTFEKEYNKVRDNYDNLYDIITKASIIEREAKLDNERNTIAGVVENRLKSNMRLQLCATVLYVITNGEYSIDKVTYKDLEVSSPYNTYQSDGLPPGPISNPGLKSIEAALNPETHNYLFYHTNEEKKDGSHIFTQTFQGHMDTMN